MACGMSMYPTLQDGKKYEVVLDIGIVDVGDIIVFKYNDLVICHRVVKVLKSRRGHFFFKTQGDNCPIPDPFAVTPEMVVGKIETIL